MQRFPSPSLDSLDRLVQRAFSTSTPAEIEPMAGGASTRRFFRVTLDDGSSAVAMFFPDAMTSDELGKADSGVPRWPFLEVRDLLHEHGVRVPRVLAEACEDGFILVEDLGDDTLANYLLRRPEDRELLYKSAISDLARAQQVLAALPTECVVRTRSFDQDLLGRELDHFREWAIEGRGIELSSADRETFQEARDYLARTISEWPQGFVHRDYQSRNLMVRIEASGQPELVWIDFQDALLGPRIYDVVALLNDSYQTFDREFIDRRLEEFADQLGLDAAGRASIPREFEMVTIQRKLKDAGRFVFLDRVKKNPAFLKFVDATIAKARGAMRRLEGDATIDRLAELVDRLCPAQPAAKR
jgi:hypothetical protein